MKLLLPLMLVMLTACEDLVSSKAENTKHLYNKVYASCTPACNESNEAFNGIIKMEVDMMVCQCEAK